MKRLLNCLTLCFVTLQVRAQGPCVKILNGTFMPTRPQTAIVLGILGNARGQVLLGRRQPPQDWVGLWEFPGGKVEGSELPEEALRREFKEEIGVDIEVGGLLMESLQEFDSKILCIRFYRVVARSGNPQPIAHSQLAWVDRAGLVNYPLLVPNHPIYEEIWP